MCMFEIIMRLILISLSKICVLTRPIPRGTVSLGIYNVHFGSTSIYLVLDTDIMCKMGCVV